MSAVSVSALGMVSRLAPDWPSSFALQVGLAIVQHESFDRLDDHSLEVLINKVIESVDFVRPLRQGAYPSSADVERYVENAFVGGC